jgi:hypothetical protein
MAEEACQGSIFTSEFSDEIVQALRGGIPLQFLCSGVQTIPGPCIYALTDPNGEVRYVGQAKNLARRFKQHLTPTSGSTYRERWLRSLLAQGEEPCVFVLCVPDDLDEAEIFWIKTLRAAGFRLVNTADGGHSLAHAHRAKAKSEWATRHTPIQRIMLRRAMRLRALRADGQTEKVEEFERRTKELRSAIAKARRRGGAAAIADLNRYMAAEYPRLAGAA